MSTKDLLLETIKRGMNIEYKRISLNELSDVRQLVQRQYQVHSEHHNYKFSGLYDKPEDAVEKFMDIYRKVRYNK